MSKNWVKDNAAMHKKFGVHEALAKLDNEKLMTFLKFRLDFLEEELNEAKTAFNTPNVNSAEDVVDAMVDLCVVAIGTLDLFGADAYEAWDRVHKANMKKKVGIKPGRPNPLGLPDLIKPKNWESPTHADLVGNLTKLFPQS
jgi:predicted HAD superfamily Cof-like phosphohydrolase